MLDEKLQGNPKSDVFGEEPPKTLDFGGIDVGMMFSRLAVGLMRQEDARQHGRSRPVSHLDEYLQQGWNELYALCLISDIPGPRHLPELVEWLHKPLENWPVIGPHIASQLKHEGALLSYGMPTETCRELDREMGGSINPEREIADLPSKRILDLCWSGQLSDGFDPAEQYTRWRTFVNRKNVLFEGKITIVSDPGWAPEIREELLRCYEPILQACIRYEEGKPVIARCRRCGWPLQWSARNPHVAKCYSRLCEEQVPQFHFPPLLEPIMPDVALQTTAGIQASDVGPEVALMRLYDTLMQEMGLQCELWPHIDQPDLVVTLSDKMRWAADMKDYESPAYLAKTISGKFFPTPEPWDRMVLLLPDHRKKPSYRETLKQLWIRPEGQHIDILYVSEFLRQIERHEQQLREEGDDE
jgi:REase associating with pPIWI_RE/pPIWI_RE three-gene island domain Y